MDNKDRRIRKAREVLQSFFSVAKLANDFARKNAEELGVTFQQLSVINTLKIYPGVTLKKLSEKLPMQLSLSSLSLIVEKLVVLKLVEREISQQDRRAIKLRLTEAGLNIAIESEEKAYSFNAMNSALARMNPKDVETLLNLHNELLLNLKEIKGV
ncbi:transcriptional regulator [[Clostridium] sordellii]|uniref:MarR family winged helix-turn-helix transcriptional regulator n=1 Tax=Paraclostridium sordellii TaxID=1505 RepID=UPI0005E9518D|nr:MarR family winged helix-turn-helix transcriptional regulator [Paeniclostridium sordellii]MDU7968042.1 MarR family winged helix-turn-helix transcriptional regulator [Paeniclostridium sordellii]CEQ22395.1 transcriptional regulator [[Clostridium] sordellii] [Paeniclostridium sordellii]